MEARVRGGAFPQRSPAAASATAFAGSRACPASPGLPRPSARPLLGGTRSRPGVRAAGGGCSSPGPHAQPSELAPVRFGPPSLRSPLSDSADEPRGGPWPWGFSRVTAAAPERRVGPRAPGSPPPRVCARAPVQGRLAGRGGTEARGRVSAVKPRLRGSSGARPPPPRSCCAAAARLACVFPPVLVVTPLASRASGLIGRVPAPAPTRGSCDSWSRSFSVASKPAAAQASPEPRSGPTPSGCAARAPAPRAVGPCRAA